MKRNRRELLTRQSVSRLRDGSGVFATRVLFAAALVMSFEIFWSLELAYEHSAGRIVVWFSMVVGLMVAAEAIGVAAGWLARNIGGRYAPAAIVVLAAPWAVLAAESLFSGGYISTVPGIVVIKVVFVTGLAGGVAVLARIYGRVRRAESPRVLIPWAMALVLGILWIGWLDNHVQVGLYPAFHLLLLAGLCWCASLASRLVVPEGGLPWRGASAASLAAVVAALVYGAATWRSTEATHVVTYTNGVAPKYRTVVVAARNRLGRSTMSAEAGPRIDPFEDLQADWPQESFTFQPTSGETVAAIRARTRNVVFVLLDALRNDYVGRTWEGASLTPTLDRLQEEVVVFANHYSPSDHTGRSMPSLMTSLPLPVVQQVAHFEVPLTTWIDVLRSASFKTFSNGACDYVSRKVRDVNVSYCFGTEIQGTLNGRSPSLVAEIRDFIAGVGDARFAVYTHWVDAHIEVSRTMEPVYRDKVRVLDRRLGELIEMLHETGRWDDTMLIVTADHGYSLGERNKVLSHGGTIERQVRVPLFVRLPGSGWHGRVVEQNVGGCEIAPTIVDTLAPDANWRAASRSLLNLLADPEDVRAGNRHVVFASNGEEHMVRRGSHKLIWNANADTMALFDLASDPDETRLYRDGDLARELRTAMNDEFRRQRALAVHLVRAREQEIAPTVLALLMHETVSDAEMADLLSRFWAFNAPTRRYVLEQIFRRDIDGVRQALDALARGRWDQDDQFLLLVRTYAGSADAGKQLSERYRDLRPEARRWFGDMLAYMPTQFVRSISERLMEDIAALRASDPPLGSPEERYMTMCTFGLVSRLRDRAPFEAKELLRERYTAYEKIRPRHSYNTLRESNFYNVYFLRGLRKSLTEDELSLLDGLGMNRAVARCIAATCLRLSTERSKAYLLDVLRRESVAAHVIAMSDYLRACKDGELRRQANAIIQEKFPNLEPVE